MRVAGGEGKGRTVKLWAVSQIEIRIRQVVRHRRLRASENEDQGWKERMCASDWSTSNVTSCRHVRHADPMPRSPFLLLLILLISSYLTLKSKTCIHLKTNLSQRKKEDDCRSLVATVRRSSCGTRHPQKNSEEAWGKSSSFLRRV